MLQGLAIRQVFMLLDGILVVLMLAGMSYVAFFAFKPSGNTKQALAITPTATSTPLATVKPRSEYEALVSSGLFGAAGSSNLAAAATPLEVEEADTELHLTLKGTSATFPKDIFANAIIENKDSGITDTYQVSESVSNDATLEEVYPAKVVLFNHRTQRKEVLRIDDANQVGGATATMASAVSGRKGMPPQPQNAGPNRKPNQGPAKNAARGPAISVPKQQLVEQVLANPSEVLTKLQPEIARDASGNPTGLTAKNIDSLPIAKTLGLQNGDVLQSVNGEMIDSVSKIAEIAGKYGNSANLNITVLRNGKPITMTYNLE